MSTLNDKNIPRTVNISGKICPYTLIETRDALKLMYKGQVLEVICDYEPAAKTTIPNFCKQKGYPFEVIEREKNLWKILIEKND